MSDNNRGNIVSFKATGWVEREVADKFAKRIVLRINESEDAYLKLKSLKDAVRARRYPSSEYSSVQDFESLETKRGVSEELVVELMGCDVLFDCGPNPCFKLSVHFYFS